MMGEKLRIFMQTIPLYVMMFSISTHVCLHLWIMPSIAKSNSVTSVIEVNQLIPIKTGPDQENGISIKPDILVWPF